MKIGIVTEMSIFGKISKDYPNMRTEFVWAWMLDADFIPYSYFDNIETYINIIENYDFLLFIPSKKHPEYLINVKNCPIKCAIMQEGGRYQWLEWATKYQELYLECLQSVDVVLCHNESDIDYFKQFTSKPVEKLSTYQFVNKYKELRKINRKENIFIGGQFTAWYGGRHSYEVVKDFEWNMIGFPSMGRIQPDEKEVIEIKDCRTIYNDYVLMADYMQMLNEYKYAIHLMPINAAGSFSLGCAILGIPCIGNCYNDTDAILFPTLTVDPNDSDIIKCAKCRLDDMLNDIDYYINYADNHLFLFDAEKQKETLQNQFRRYINANE